MNDKYYAGKDICEVITELFEHIGAMPAADVVKVVRCKDCKWFVDEGMLCGNNIFIHFDHFYCYYGERKEDEGGNR